MYLRITAEKKPVPSQPEPAEGSDLYQKLVSETESDPLLEKPEPSKTNMLDTVEEIRHQQVGRMPGDTVLKILMQKVRSLDLSLSVLERYLEDLNSRYGNIFKEFDKEIEEKDVLLENIRSDIKSFLDSKETIVCESLHFHFLFFLFFRFIYLRRSFFNSYDVSCSCRSKMSVILFHGNPLFPCSWII